MSGTRARSGWQSRVEQEAARRRRRAQAHLRRTRKTARWSTGRRRALLAFSFVAALLLGSAASNFVLMWTLGARAEPVRVERIGVQGHAHLTVEAVAAATGIARGSALRDVNADRVAERLRAHPWIRNARALVVPIGPGAGTGGRLWLQIEERDPISVLVGPAAAPAHALWIDRNGTPFAPARPGEASAATRIRGVGPFRRGEPSDLLARAVWLSERLRELGVGPPCELALPEDESPEGWVLRFGTPARHVVFGRNRIEERLKQLSVLLDSELAEAARAERIDLRFDGRAVLVLADWGVRGQPVSR